MKYIPIFFIVVLANANLLAQVDHQVIGPNMIKQISENWPYSTSQQDQTDVNYQPRVTNCNNSNSDLNCYLMMDPSKIQQSSKLGRDLTQMFDQGILNNRKPVIEKPPGGMTSVFNTFSNSSNMLNSATPTTEAISGSFSSQVFGSKKLEGEDLKSTKKINEGLDSLTSDDFRQALEAYPCAGRLIIVEEGGVISIQARDAVQNASERNKSENKKIIDKLRELFPELAADSLLRYQVSSNNSKISMGVDSLTSSRLREILAKVDKEIAEEEDLTSDSSSEEDANTDINDMLRGEIQDNIETIETYNVATSVQKRAKQAENKFKKQSSDLVSECDTRSITSSMARSSTGIRKNLYTVKKIQLGSWVKKGFKNSPDKGTIDTLKTELEIARIRAEEVQNKLLQMSAAQTLSPEIETARTAWNDAEMEARYAAMCSNTAESEKTFAEAVRLSKKTEEAWNKAFEAKNALLTTASETDQPSLRDKIQEAEIRKSYWADKTLWNEAGKIECSAKAALQQGINHDSLEETDRQIQLASDAEEAWNKAAAAFGEGKDQISESLKDLKDQWMTDLEKAEQSKNDWAQKANDLKKEEEERKSALEIARIKAEEERIALENKKSERLISTKKAAETAALKVNEVLDRVEKKSEEDPCSEESKEGWREVLEQTRHAKEAWEKTFNDYRTALITTVTGSTPQTTRLKTEWQSELCHAKNEKNRWDARIAWRKATQKEHEVTAFIKKASKMQEGNDESITAWSTALELGKKAKEAIEETVKIYGKNIEKAGSNYKKDWEQVWERAKESSTRVATQVAEITKRKNKTETAKEKAKEAAEQAVQEMAMKIQKEAAEQAAKERSVKIQAAQEIWQRCLTEHATAAEKYQLVLTVAKQYFSVVAMIEPAEAEIVRTKAILDNKKTQLDDASEKKSAAYREKIRAFSDIPGGSDEAKNQFVDRYWGDDRNCPLPFGVGYPVSARAALSKAESSYSIANSSHSEANSAFFRAKDACSRAHTARSNTHSEASTAINAAVADIESLTMAAQKSDNADTQAGMSLESYWTTVLNAYTREKNAWKSIIDSASSWNACREQWKDKSVQAKAQAQLQEAQKATEEVETAFQALKEAREKALL